MDPERRGASSVPPTQTFAREVDSRFRTPARARGGGPSTRSTVPLGGTLTESWRKGWRRRGRRDGGDRGRSRSRERGRPFGSYEGGEAHASECHVMPPERAGPLVGREERDWASTCAVFSVWSFERHDTTRSLASRRASRSSLSLSFSSLSLFLSLSPPPFFFSLFSLSHKLSHPPRKRWFRFHSSRDRVSLVPRIVSGSYPTARAGD